MTEPAIDGPRRKRFAPSPSLAAGRPPTEFDLQAYFERIGYSGGRTPTLATLHALIARHTEELPFENLDALLGRPIDLDAPSLQQKMLREGRGGWCFEHNLLLADALQALGFAVVGLAARVMWTVPADAIRPRSHMLLRIELDGRPWIADVGFGGMTLTGALRLETDIEQATPHEPFRLLAAAGDFVLQARLAGAWKSLYRFDKQPSFVADYEIHNWYLSHHPDSHFVRNLMASRIEPGRRYTLLNDEFTLHPLNGKTEKRVLASVPELRATLQNELRLTLPQTPALDAALERVLRGAAARRG